MQKIIKPPLKNLILKNEKLYPVRNFQLSPSLCGPKADFPSNLNVFDRNTKKIQRNSLANDPNFKDYEYIKSEIGFRLADRIFDIKRNFNSMLDLGCQRGYVSKHLTKVTLFKISCPWLFSSFH
jgi:hypothetical protein